MLGVGYVENLLFHLFEQKKQITEKEQRMKQYKGKDIVALTEKDNFEDAKGRTLVVADGDDYKELAVTLVKIKGLTIDYEIPNYKPKASVKLYRYANAGDKPRFKVGDAVYVYGEGKYLFFLESMPDSQNKVCVKEPMGSWHVPRTFSVDASLLRKEYTPRRMTNFDLAKWLAKGNGLVKYDKSNTTQCSHVYKSDEHESFVETGTKIFPFMIKQWMEPILE